MKTVLSIAGSDCSGGAGIQADIKTITMNGVYAMSVITAMTAQNTTGVFSIAEISADFIKQQIDAVFTDIFPDAVKIGMLPSPEAVSVVAERLKYYDAKNIIVDPVMVATSGEKLTKNITVKSMEKELFPLADLLTPNIPEGEYLLNVTIKSSEDMKNASKMLSDKYKCSVLLKGGHCADNSDDILYSEGCYVWYKSDKINNPNTHGTGCTLSSAIASNIAKGYSLEKSIEISKNYVKSAVEDMLDLGNGSGPINHMFSLR